MRIKQGQQKLTKAQETYLEKFAKRQIEKYLSTKQALSDKQIKLCVNNAYRVSGLDLPKKIRWFKSPEALTKAVWASVGDSVRASVRASVWDSVRASVWDSVRASVRASVWDSVGDSVGDSVWASVGASVRDSVGASVGDSVRASVRDSVRAWYDSDDLSFYRLFHNCLKPNDLIWLSKLSENVTGYGFYKKECWLVRKPTTLTRDEEGRLHGENGMAIKWPNGAGYYFYRGVKVTKKIIETPSKLTKKDWLKEENTEVRRIIQERMPDFVKKIGGKLTDKSVKAELYEVDISPDPEKLAKYLKVKDASTKRVYWLRVPPTIKKAKVGVAWTFKVKAKDYNLEQET